MLDRSRDLLLYIIAEPPIRWYHDSTKFKSKSYRKILNIFLNVHEICVYNPTKFEILIPSTHRKKQNIDFCGESQSNHVVNKAFLTVNYKFWTCWSSICEEAVAKLEVKGCPWMQVTEPNLALLFTPLYSGIVRVHILILSSCVGSRLLCVWVLADDVGFGSS